MNTEDDTYAAKAKTILAPTPVIATTTMVEHPTRVTISGGGPVPEGGSVQGTSGLALARGPSRGKASGRIGPGIVQASSGQTSGSQTTTGTVVQSGGSTPTGNQVSGSGSGSGQTGGQTTGTGQTGGGPPLGGQPPAAPAGRPPGGPQGNPPGGSGGGGGGGSPPPAPAAAAAGQAGPVPAGNGALKGHPPEVFDGNRSKAKKFMKEFMLWKLCNLNNEALSVPFSRVALCLSYIKGPNVDDWVSATTDDVYEKVHGGPGGRAATHQLDDECYALTYL